MEITRWHSVAKADSRDYMTIVVIAINVKQYRTRSHLNSAKPY